MYNIVTTPLVALVESIWKFPKISGILFFEL